MLSTNVRNNILNALYGRQKDTGGLIPTSGSCYLGFSTAAPTISAAGECTAFPEPAASTGYVRLELRNSELNDAAAIMPAAAAGEIKNSTANLTFDAPNDGQSYGKATHIGLFTEKTGGLPIMVIQLATEVTLGLKATLVLEKNKLTTALTAADVTA
nr:MAG TPA: hypothetical protein [Caudoviricetes sp.]